MDNFKVEVVADSGLEDLIDFVCKRYTRVVAYRIHPEKGMIFYWTQVDKNYAKPGYVELPYSFSPSTVHTFVSGWLKEMPDTDWDKYAGQEPDHDGSTGRGFKLYNEAWGHVDGEWQTFFAIKPNWAWYGK